MPKKRQPREVCQTLTNPRIFDRDGGRCVRCKRECALTRKDAKKRGVMVCNIDHIISGKKGTNEDDNLRTLCLRCHVLRGDFRHNGMRAKAIKNGIIPPDYRPLLWWD